MKETGRLSKLEMHKIDEMASSFTPEKIAEALNRRIEPIIEYLKKTGQSKDKMGSMILQAEHDIKEKLYWKNVKAQLYSKEEEELFLYHWSRIVAQFNKDVMPTEEFQIVDLIMLEIKMHRLAIDEKDLQEKIRDFERDLDLERRAGDDKDDDRIYMLNQNIASFRAEKDSTNRAWRELFDKKEKSQKALKTTREQRYEKVQNSKQTMSELIERIIKDPNFNEEQGKAMEQMRLAMRNEFERLKDYHKYEDGELDRPFLTPESV